MVELEKLSARYAEYLTYPFHPEFADWVDLENAFNLACLVDARCLLYSSQDYWRYLLPRFITFDWREDIKLWRNEPSSLPRKSS